jgi:very-short-patch-repair endonuclease
MDDDLKNTGMHGGAIPQIFNRARALRKKMTQPEIMLWDFLKTKPLGFKFRRQHPFDMYVLDFFCLKARLSIEIDGINHQWKSQKIQDKFRTEVLAEYNIHQLRFVNKEVIDEFEKVKQQIISVLIQHSQIT